MRGGQARGESTRYHLFGSIGHSNTSGTSLDCAYASRQIQVETKRFVFYMRDMGFKYEGHIERRGDHFLRMKSFAFYNKPREMFCH
jgi:hypothetical protein